MRTARRLPGLFLSLSAVAVSVAVFAATRTLKPVQGAGPTAIDESAYIRIGGIDQWVTIRGEDRDNPVVLFLHGGPGSVLTPFATNLFHDWEKSFTMVQWDQRGAGRSYARTGPSIEPTMTMDQMAQDGVKLADYLRSHLNKKKIILTGGSWGSVLGVYMARMRPDLFAAYIGTAQIVSADDWVAGYKRTLELARQAGDENAVKELESIGPPPWDHIRKFGAWSRWTRVFESKSSDPALVLKPSAEYASETELRQTGEAADFSQVHFFGLEMRGPLAVVNLPALGTDFKLPVFIVQGEADLKAVPEVTRAYFEQIQAPKKQFVLVPRAGHEPNATMLAAILKLLNETVRPLALTP